LRAQTAPQPDDPFFRPAAEIDKILPHWIQFSGSDRVRTEDQEDIGYKANHSDFHVLNELWLGVAVRPESWLTFFGQAQDSRMFLNGVDASAPPYQNTWDVHQAWVQLGDVEKYPVTVRVGRQELAFGDQRLIGPSPWLNAPRVFDAAVATFRITGVRVDAFASSVVNSVDGQMDHHKQGNPFYGAYGTIGKLIPKASIEPYAFWRLAPVGYGAAYADGAKGHLNEGTFGVRIAGKLPAHFDYGTEMARQKGTLGTSNIGAWAGHWVAGRTFETAWTPRAYLEYNYSSGTSNPHGNTVGTFDQLYPSGHDKYGLDDQVGWRNIKDLRAGVEAKPIRKLKVSATYHDYWLADAHDGLYSTTGAVVAKSLAGTAGTHVGEELDFQGVYKWNSAVLFGAGYGRLFTAEFLNKTTNGKDYGYPYFMTSYVF
jgi:hypothetical protein